MPIFKYNCDNCGFEQEQFLRDDKETVSIVCKRCQRTATAFQVRDNSVEVLQNDYVHGTVRHEEARA